MHSPCDGGAISPLQFSGWPRLRWLPPPRLPSTPHPGLAQGRARAAAWAMGLRLRSRAHLVEGGLARGVAFVAGAVRRDLVIERDAHFVEGGFVDAASATACAWRAHP